MFAVLRKMNRASEVAPKTKAKRLCFKMNVSLSGLCSSWFDYEILSIFNFPYRMRDFCLFFFFFFSHKMVIALIMTCSSWTIKSHSAIWNNGLLSNSLKWMGDRKREREIQQQAISHFKRLNKNEIITIHFFFSWNICFLWFSIRNNHFFFIQKYNELRCTLVSVTYNLRRERKRKY